MPLKNPCICFNQLSDWSPEAYLDITSGEPWPAPSHPASLKKFPVPDSGKPVARVQWVLGLSCLTCEVLEQAEERDQDGNGDDEGDYEKGQEPPVVEP